MRLIVALGLTLVLGIGAALRPSNSLPGREVGAAESSYIVGGACGFPKNANCSGGTCGANAGALPGGVVMCNLIGTTCNTNCSIWAGFNCACGG
jgi:hypothetical protein